MEPCWFTSSGSEAEASGPLRLSTVLVPGDTPTEQEQRKMIPAQATKRLKPGIKQADG
jgi:hypothetical protein